MSKCPTPEKSEGPSDELSPQTVMAPTPSSLTEPMSQFLEEEDEEDDMPIVLFDWEDDNADVFLQRWETRNAQVSQLKPSFDRPASSSQLYTLLLKEFVRDIDGASMVCKTCIQCNSSIAFALMAVRMDNFEARPWVSTIIGGELPGSAKLANFFVTTSVHKSKPIKLESKLF